MSTKRKPPEGRRFKPGQSGNPKGRPRKDHSITEQLRLDGNRKIPRLLYARAMQMLDYSRTEIARVLSGEKVPSEIKSLTFNQLASKMRWYEALTADDGWKILAWIVERTEGKAVQPTTIANPDGSPLEPGHGDVLIVTVDEHYGEKS